MHTNDYRIIARAIKNAILSDENGRLRLSTLLDKLSDEFLLDNKLFNKELFLEEVDINKFNFDTVFRNPINSLNGNRFIDERHKKELLTMFENDEVLNFDLWDMNAPDGADCLSSVCINLRTNRIKILHNYKK